jgi:lipoate-protein ligase A
VGKQRTAKREIFYEGTPFVSSFMRDLIRYLELQLKKGGQDKEDGTHSPKECVTYLVGEFTHMPRILVPKS